MQRYGLCGEYPDYFTQKCGEKQGLSPHFPTDSRFEQINPKCPLGTLERKIFDSIA
jgi:hypothetical protein